MTRYKLLTAIGLIFITVGLSAQTYQDLLRYSQPQYMGTARSMAMGGAFGSLGGDFSALSINPAGIAVYRTSEFSITPSLILNSTESSFNRGSINDNKTTFALNQVGYVGTYRPMREVSQGIVSSHFAIGYNRNNNFNYKSMASARGITTSMTDMFTSDAWGFAPEVVGSWGNLTGLAYNAYLINYDDTQGIYTADIGLGETVDQTRIIEKEGYAGEINVTGGINISNKVLLGASINFTSLSYREISNYYEAFSTTNTTQGNEVFDRFTVQNDLDVSGRGVNLKIGTIIKPTEQIRLGLAYHSPTWFIIDENYGSRLDASFFNPKYDDNNELIGTSTFARNYNNALNTFDYKLNTPGVFTAGASYVIGKKAIVSFDYEYINYANAKFKSRSSNIDDLNAITTENEIAKDIFDATNNFRAGVEYRVSQQISLRAGYSHQASPYKTDKNDLIEPFNSLYGTQKVSDLQNDYQITGYSAGIGYRSKNYFIDVAYRLTSFDNSYFNYNWPSNVNTDLDLPLQTTIKTTDHYATLTVGWKF
ncbi:Outer membrane protein transport protein (OMPP1/FadL/TodX) [Saccharicrinis carchari]|uniref:Outer membrane protein transport protein (OMPP1/FadL/TodX) n=1 Tax=Saccharicrinis carchari TaxID=1168039 RepID=A0A521B2X1_SACCC|nr:outer membrane protein transport protein [Saccharicrinis carchari]SMO41443.1 Outer membrane protein transport protein (OMPP1/FadL/TodX) [Saccharicrinis carchari]